MQLSSVRMMCLLCVSSWADRQCMDFGLWHTASIKSPFESVTFGDNSPPGYLDTRVTHIPYVSQAQQDAAAWRARAEASQAEAAPALSQLRASQHEVASLRALTQAKEDRIQVGPHLESEFTRCGIQYIQ